MFSGSATFSRIARLRGNSSITYDNDESLHPDICADISDYALYLGPSKPDVIWASPPCQGFSVAAFGKNWGGGFRAYEPKSESAKLSIRCLRTTLEIIRFLNPKLYFIENPMGMMRKMPEMQAIRRVEVSYCQYGDTRMKPTDIFTNSHWIGRPKCKNGSICHVSAPRGSKTLGSTQGLKGAYLRGKLPDQLCVEIIEACEKELIK